MLDFFYILFMTQDIPSFSISEGWPPGLVWLHNASDLFIWLAFLSIPLVLVSFAWRRKLMPFHTMFWLFSGLMVTCGFTHLLEAISLHVPVQWLVGLAKMVTAVMAWTAIFALIPLLPRALDFQWEIESAEHVTRRPEVAPSTRWQSYAIALALLLLATMVRAGFDAYLAERIRYFPFVVAVVFAAWNGGIGPGLLTLLGGVLVTSYVVKSPASLTPEAILADQLGIGLYIVSGVAVALLSEAQLAARRRASASISQLIEKRQAMEAEVQRRREAESRVRRREEQLRSQTIDLAQAQRQTAESLAMMNTFIMNAPVGMAFLDPELRFIRVNERLARMNGLCIEDHLGRLLTEVLPNAPSAALRGLLHVLETGEPIIDRIFPDGSEPGVCAEHIWQVSVYPVMTESEVVLGVGVVSQEITDRIQTQKRLEESETRFRTLAEAVPQIVWTTGPDGGVEYFNHRWHEYTGMGPQESSGWGWIRAVHPDDHALARRLWTQATDTGTPYEIEYRIRGRDGSYRWFLGRGTPQRDESGRIIRWFGTCTDINDLKCAQEDLRHSEERFRLLAQNVPQIVWRARPDGVIEDYNSQWYGYTGLQRSRPDRTGWRPVVHDEDRETNDLAWRTALDRGDPFEAELRLCRHDGVYRWHLVRGTPLKDDASGEVVQWVGTITDIDDQKRQAETLERLIRERTAELERSNGELEQFAYVASHDLQEPLRKIQAFGDRLASKYRELLGDQGRDYLDRILSSAGRMRNLINDLLIFSRVTTKALPFVPVDLAQVVNEVASDLEGQIQQVAGTVEIGPLPTIEADPLQMRQLFQNLIANALKFHKPGVPPVVSVEGSILPVSQWPEDAHSRAWCEIQVTDRGIGFDEAYLDRIFQVFQRLHGRHEFEGTGVGLAICRKIVERHGGRITARSAPDQGATFVITVPVHQPEGTTALESRAG